MLDGLEARLACAGMVQQIRSSAGPPDVGKRWRDVEFVPFLQVKNVEFVRFFVAH